MGIYSAGIDIGSTTVKLVVLDEDKNIIYGNYRRHLSHTQVSLAELLEAADTAIKHVPVRVKLTGSGSINLARSLGVGFVQEVVAVAAALQRTAPQTDVAIELGGEDAKIIYFTGGLEERMNGVCAGGTGSFIDQMASLLQTDAAGLNEAAAEASEIYPIAARCGVFAKSDIQPLINEGARRSDLAASIFRAVVNQTISGLACGKPIRGCVAFLGGPLHFLPELKKSFIETLRLSPENIVDPENSHLFAAMGAALEADGETEVSLGEISKKLRAGVKMEFEIKRLPPLFSSEADYSEFVERHSRARVNRADLSAYSGDCFLGIDAGSTTTKLAVINTDGELLYSYYDNNHGDPIKTAISAVSQLREILPPSARIARSCSTGYGEALLKSAFSLDEGEVETIAHCTAASFFDPEVDCVLDIGGQDMKCIKLKNRIVDAVMLNEACSSGCGSFIENFASSLGYSAPEFSRLALFAKNPVDLGTRCTVFMNSSIKQAQKEGASVEDISAGLACSVIKNALFKVIKLTDARELGNHVVVQGGTFCSHAVLRAFEQISGADAVCPDISGLMGAFGAALIARNSYEGQETVMMPLDEICSLSYTSTTIRCGRCQNNCLLTVNRFPGGRRHISGNRCEKGLGSESAGEKAPNLYDYKFSRIFGYDPLSEDEAPRGVLGIPRVLNIYENYPYWATFFRELGFSVVLSPPSGRSIYELGMESIPSESECYPAKLAHGHIQWLIDSGVKTIFYPSVYYEFRETPGAQNTYNCPIVVGYPENLKNNVESITDGAVRFIHPFIAFSSEKTAEKRLVELCAEEWNIPASETRAAARMAWIEQRKAKDDIRAEGRRVLGWMEENGRKGIVLAGRPYHVDPEINHGIPDMISSYGLAVLSEDSLPVGFIPQRPLRVNDQWVFHSRLYTAAEFVTGRGDLELVQLNSFGCGLDAITTDQACEILEKRGRAYTVLKIDEVNNLGAARIRIRSLLAASRLRGENPVSDRETSLVFDRSRFTGEMKDQGYTIIAPQMSPIHFDILEPVFRKYGYNIVVLDNDNRHAIDTGLRYVNNDACFPSITTIGQIMDAVLSGEYDTDRLAIIMSQTGGCCRASNYIGFIRRALVKAGLSHIPVISLNVNGMEKNPGFSLSPGLLMTALRSIVYGDLIMRCLYRVRPYEVEPGSADVLRKKWTRICVDSLVSGGSTYAENCRGIVEDFDNLPIHEDMRKPRVGVVGEILVKYLPLANNHLVDLIEKEGGEAAVPDLMDYINSCIYEKRYRYRYLGAGLTSEVIPRIAVPAVRKLRSPALKALERSRRFEAPMPIERVAELAEPFLSICNQYGEGWFLAGEMAELLNSGVPNIVCAQPFACLPNHIVGKGVIKMLRKHYADANIVAVDYDPGASEVNQLNRIMLMLSAAKKKLLIEEGAEQTADR